MQLKFNLNSV